MERWWDRYGERYRGEIDAFEEAGIEYAKDEDRFAAGKLVLHVKYPVNGQLLDLTIKYPDSYPFFRPQILAPNVSLPFHHNPREKTLCLLDQPTDAWDVEETAYELLRQQLPKVLAAGKTHDRMSVSGIETHQAEPRTEYYEYKPGSVLLIDGSWTIDDAIQRGLFVLAGEGGKNPYEAMKEPMGLRGAVLEIQAEDGNPLCSAEESILGIYPAKPKLTGRWIRLARAPEVVTPKELIDFLRSNYPEDAKYIENRANGGKGGVVGFVFPENKTWLGDTGIGWLFLAFYGKRRKKNSAQITAYLTRAERAGPQDFRERIPELSLLKDKTLAVVGCGCVGAPSVLEFARAGIGEIRLWDGDSVSPGNTCRWPLGLPFSGWNKVNALLNFVRVHYPHVKLGPSFGFQLGNPDFEEGESLDGFLQGVDLLFDATAERGVQLYLASLANARGIPYVMAESRHGGWGGLVARILPGAKTGCYYCLMQALSDDTIIPPPGKEEDFLQPQGCISPTFTAASFDTSTVSLAAVRLAVSTLCAGHAGVYPSIEHDVGVLSVRAEDPGMAAFPVWTTYHLSKHQACSCEA